ncbi:MAG: ATP-binding protein [Bacteroidales bacterium]
MKLKIGSDIENLHVIENGVDEIMNKIGIEKDRYGHILVATMEAVNNAIVHGNSMDERKNVNICLEYDKMNFIVRVKDQGMGFNHESVPDPTSPDNIENIHGRGVFLMKRLSDDIGFNDTGNEVIMKFKIE